MVARAQSRLVALLALALAAAPATMAQSPCKWDLTGYSAPGWSGFCGTNPAWVSKQVAYAPLAKYTVKFFQAQLACSKYNVTSGSASAVAACVGDTANACLLDGTPGAWQCTSDSNPFFASNPCPGTVYAEYVGCLAKAKAQCSGACIWQPQLSRNYTRFLEFDKASGGNFNLRGWCFPKKYTGTFTTASQLSTFIASFGVSPTNAADYARIRGTCQYAKDGAKRFAYDEQCDSYNNAKDQSLGLMLGSVDSTGVGKFTGVNVKALTACLQSGCTIDYIPSSVTWGYGEDWFGCATDATRRYSYGYYGPKDTALLQVTRLCSDITVRYNKTLCEAVVI